MDIKSVLKNSLTSFTEKGISFTLDKYDSLLNKEKSETLFIHGFWRSGTTHLQELMSHVFKTRTYIEPWNEACPETRKSMDKCGIYKDEIFRKLYMPVYSSCMEEWVELLERKRLSGRWVYGISNLEYFRREYNKRMIVKFVRGAFIVPEISSRTGSKWIFIKRDLLGNMDSFLRTKWTHWFNELDLEKLLLDKYHSASYEKFFDFIMKYNREGFIEKIAAYKLLTDMYIEKNIHGLNGMMISYEDLCTDPEKILHQLSEYTNWKIENKEWDHILFKPSKFVSICNVDTNGKYTFNKKTEIDKETKRRVMSIENEFYRTLETSKA